MDPATMMLLGGLISGGIGALTGDKAKTGSTYSANQRKGIEEILNDIRSMKSGAQDIKQNPNYMQGQDWLSSLFNDQDFFKSFEAPLQRQFQEETVPGLANRFASMGSGGSLGSTAFRNQLGREGSNLSTNIAALRGGLQQQGVNQGLQYAQQPFQNLLQLMGVGLTPTKNTYTPANTGLFGGLAAPLMQGAGAIWGQQAGQQAGLNSGQFPSTF